MKPAIKNWVFVCGVKRHQKWTVVRWHYVKQLKCCSSRSKFFDFKRPIVAESTKCITIPCLTIYRQIRKRFYWQPRLDISVVLFIQLISTLQYLTAFNVFREKQLLQKDRKSFRSQDLFKNFSQSGKLTKRILRVTHEVLLVYHRWSIFWFQTGAQNFQSICI